MPFREAHGVVGELVRHALDDGRPLSELERDELASFSELLDDEYYEVLSTERCARGQALGRRDGARRRRRPAPRGRAGARRGLRLSAASRPAPNRRRRRSDRRAAGRGFFARSVHDVAADLIGCALLFDGVGGVIVETESYDATTPPATPTAGSRRAARCCSGRPGRAYVYFSYGVHSLLNAVAEPEGRAAAVLIRALEPLWGLGEMRARRGRSEPRELCSGPGQAHRGAGHRARAQPGAARPPAVRVRRPRRAASPASR